MELIDIINQYWGIIVSITAVIASFASLKYQNTEQEIRIGKIETAISNINTIIADRSGYGKRITNLEDDNKCIRTAQQSIDTKLASIQTDLTWIKNALKKE